VKLTACAALLGLLVAGCSTPAPQEVLSGGEHALKLRAAQTRAFETADKNQVMRAVVATLQDLGFLVSGADAALGTVTARKFTQEAGLPYDLRLTVSVRPRDARQTLVRANAEFNSKPVEDPRAYQNFFSALGKTLFLAGHEVE
jgi:hypothetical protein